MFLTLVIQLPASDTVAEGRKEKVTHLIPHLKKMIMLLGIELMIILLYVS